MGKRSRSFVCATAFAVVLSGCENSGVEDNFDRSDMFTRLTSSADLSSPSDLTPATGQATYRGVALASFSEGFTGTADVRLAVDFDTQTMNGRLQDWVDGDPRNFNLRGQIELFDGEVNNNGSFSTAMSGNLERTAVGFSMTETPKLILVGGESEGAFYNSLNGDLASHAFGELNGTTTSTGGQMGTMFGRFVAGN